MVIAQLGAVERCAQRKWAYKEENELDSIDCDEEGVILCFRKDDPQKNYLIECVVEYLYSKTVLPAGSQWSACKGPLKSQAPSVLATKTHISSNPLMDVKSPQ